MTQPRDIDRLLDLWLSDGSSVAPDRVLDVVADRIERQPQRPAWRLDWRLLPMNPIAKAGAAIAAVVLVALIGYNLLPGPTGLGGTGGTPVPSVNPPPTATPAPTAAPTAFPCEQGTPCAGQLTAGRHTSSAFQPAIAYDVPVNWTNPRDKSNTYVLHSSGGPDHFIGLYSHVAIPEQDATCKVTRRSGVGNGVADWVEFLTTHPGLHALDPETLTVGGYPATRVTFTVAATWTQTCPKSVGPAVITITGDGTVPAWKDMVDDQTTSLTIVGVPGQTVIIEVQTGGAQTNQDLVWNMVKPVIDSLTFTPAN
jgi:hypothetical protein